MTIRPIKWLKNSQLTLTLDPIAYVVNSLAMGDVIAAAAVIKHQLDNAYVTPESHTVVAKSRYRELFPYVSDSNWVDFESTDRPQWGIDPSTPIALFNHSAQGKIVRNTPKKVHLLTYASYKLTDSIIPLDQLHYVPLTTVPIDSSIDWSRAVILVSTYRDTTRRWPAKHMLEFATWLLANQYIPVFVGKTDMEVGTNQQPRTELPADLSQYGIDLRDRTTIPQLATMMSCCLAVTGVDSGPIHLAGTTSATIICGYPTVSPELRIPSRARGITIPLVPQMECGGCESRWNTSYWNFQQCYLGHADCCEHFTADRYISALQTVIGNAA